MIIKGMNLPFIIACAVIVLILIVFPLIVSYKTEKEKKSPVAPKAEWDKIKEYGNQINKKTRSNK
jgi:hypothetical protein